jgi:DNA-binding PadR family transcriptional regulator
MERVSQNKLCAFNTGTLGGKSRHFSTKWHLDNYIHIGYNQIGMSPESFLPLPPATFHILLAVSRQDRHGYGIIQDVSARTNGKLKLSPGTLYRSIQRMLEQGLLVETEERPAPEMDDERRRYYRVTPFGEAVARAETERLSQLVRMAREQGFAEGAA